MPPPISLLPVAFLVLVGLTAGVWGQDCVYGYYRKDACNCDAGYWGPNCWQSDFCGVQTYMAPETGSETVRIVPNTSTTGGRCIWYLRGYNPNDLVSFQSTCSWCSTLSGTVTFYDGYGLEGDVLYTGLARSASVMSTDNWMTVVFDITSSSGSFTYRIESHPVEDASTPSHEYILPDGPYCDCGQCDGGDCICASPYVAPPGCADMCSGTQYNYYYEAQYHNAFSNNHGNYAPLSSCQWSYAFDEVTFSIEYFKTEPTYDTLRIYTGIEPKLWGTFDGTWSPVTFTLCGPIFMEFSSDDSYEESGFYINVEMEMALCTQNDPFPENTFVSSTPSTSEDSATFCIECFVIPIVVVSGVLCVSFIVFLRIRRSRSGTFGAVVGTQPNSTVSSRASGNNNAKSNPSSRTTVVTTKRDPDRSTESHDEEEDDASARSKSKPVPVYTGGALRGTGNVFGRKSGPTNVTASEGESADTREDTAGTDGDAYSSGYYSESPESSSSSSEKRRRRRRRSSSSKGSKKGPTKRGSSGRRHHHRRRRHGGRFDESSADNVSEDQSSTHDDEPEPKPVSEPIKNNPFLGRLSLR